MTDTQAAHDQAMAEMRNQMRAACHQMAETAATFKQELVDAGFDTDDAQDLVAVWMDRTIERWGDDTCHM